MSKEKIKKDDDATLKVNFYSLSIEVTRRCNMQCRHCMRGDAQNIDLQLDKVEKILPQISNICDLVLTGGEPSMAPNVMHKTTKQTTCYHYLIRLSVTLRKHACKPWELNRQRQNDCIIINKKLLQKLQQLKLHKLQ